MKKKIKIAGEVISPGERKIVYLNIGKLYDSTDMRMPIHVIRGYEDGPIVFLSAAVHGDEINGIEIIREVLSEIENRKIKGTILAVPIVNIFGFNSKSRYLPDRRDLNRCFPGNINGSLASRIAKIFMMEIVSKCTHGIDFHTGAIHRSNYPQIRACLDDEETRQFAKAFNAPITIDSNLRDGSLRDAARKKGVTTLLFEGGQALRFEDKVIDVGKKGCLRALRYIGTLPRKKIPIKKEFVLAAGSFWIRSPKGGTLRLKVKEGVYVNCGDLLGEILDPLGTQRDEILADTEGYIIGLNRLPLVTVGDAVIHIATTKSIHRSCNLYRDEGFFDQT